VMPPMLAAILEPTEPLSLDGLAESFQEFGRQFVGWLPHLLAALLLLVRAARGREGAAPHLDRGPR
jgi:hypothetical protein